MAVATASQDRARGAVQSAFGEAATNVHLPKPELIKLQPSEVGSCPRKTEHNITQNLETLNTPVPSKGHCI